MGCSSSKASRVHPDADASRQGPGASRGDHPSTGPWEWTVDVHKPKGHGLGASLGDTTTGALIFNIQEGGLLDQWNEANPMRQVFPGVVIIEANGCTGFWAILEELDKADTLSLRISRRTPKEAGPKWFEQVATKGRALLEQERSASGGSSFIVRLKQEGPDSKSMLSCLPSVVAGDCGVDQCAICIDDVGPDESLIQLPCGHAFHPICVTRWLTRSHAKGNSQCCPLCCQKVRCSPDGRAVIGRGRSDSAPARERSAVDVRPMPRAVIGRGRSDVDVRPWTFAQA